MVVKNQIKTIYWRELRAGDIVIVKKDERIPADMIVLAVSNPEGTLYIDTSTLDGEKHPKPRYSIKETMPSVGQLQQETADINIEAIISIIQPNPSLHHFEGFLNFVENGKKLERKVSCGINNFIYKSAMIKTTDWVIGAVVYTGKDSKVQQNGSEGRYKVSSLEKKMHFMIVILFLLQVVLSFIAIILKAAADQDSDIHFDLYLINQGADGEGTLWLICMRYFILMSTMIPISLIVNLEMVRLFQAYLISKNLDLTNKEEDRYEFF